MYNASMNGDLNNVYATISRIKIEEGKCRKDDNLIILNGGLGGEVSAKKNCACNELNALVLRHLETNEDRRYVDSKQLSAEEKHLVRYAYSALISEYPPEPLIKMTRQQVVDAKPPSKKRMYANAAESLIHKPLNSKDMAVKMFVKNERYDKEVKPPRAIQSKSPRYNIELQRYLMPIEKWFKACGYDKQMTTKGMDAYKQGKFLRGCWDQFDDPVAILHDHNRYDSRLHTGWLEEEFDYYQRFFPGDELLESLLRNQLTTCGFTKHGTQYTVKGTRLSGMPNTSLGNCCSNYGKLSSVMRKSNISKYRIVVNGDDSIVMIERKDLSKYDVDFLQSYGFKTSTNIVDEFESIDYCQCNPVITSNGWMMVRNPTRVITRTSACIDNSINTINKLTTWLASVGDCEKNVNCGVPVLQAWGQKLSGLTNKRIKLDHRDLFGKLSNATTSNVITNQARDSFFRSFGIGQQQQIYLENMINTIVIGDDMIESEDVFCPTRYIMSAE